VEFRTLLADDALNHICVCARCIKSGCLGSLGLRERPLGLVQEYTLVVWVVLSRLWTLRFLLCHLAFCVTNLATRWIFKQGLCVVLIVTGSGHVQILLWLGIPLKPNRLGCWLESNQWLDFVVPRTRWFIESCFPSPRTLWSTETKSWVLF
jgi:hypothetical protein